eukprot:564304-Rhodomonas_salina.4
MVYFSTGHGLGDRLSVPEKAYVSTGQRPYDRISVLTSGYRRVPIMTYAIVFEYQVGGDQVGGMSKHQS